MTHTCPWAVVAALGLASRLFAADGAAQPAGMPLPYAIVDTGQDRCFSNTQEIAYPKPGQRFDGQDAQHEGLVPSYRDNGDGTVSDLNTGLMWVKTPDLKNKKTYAEAVAGASACRVGGYDDWRLPSITTLYSLIDFNGYSARAAAQSKPYLDTKYFDFVYGDASRNERLIDAQYWSSTQYVGTTMNGNATVFGVNFADGRIKGYPKEPRGPRGAGRQFVRYVRGNVKYGENDFVDKGDGTVTDRATGLVWMKADSGKAMNWEDALKYAENFVLAGHDDWRLPNAKELQSIVDYSRAPDAVANRVERAGGTRTEGPAGRVGGARARQANGGTHNGAAKHGAAIDPIFDLSKVESWFWTSTTHLENHTCGFAVYICFGQAFGQMQGVRMNVHGAGAQRSDPKTGDPTAWQTGNGPQGDEVRILNYVRCVRGGNVTRKASGPAIDGTFTVGRQSSDAAGGMQRPGSPGGQGPMPGERPGQMPRQGPMPGFVQHLDKNGDGRVSRGEFDGPRDQFDVLDRNRDGFLTDDEAPKHPPPEQRPRK